MSAVTASSFFKIAVSTALTGAVIALCWFIWEETPGLIRRTPLQDYRHLVSLLAIYLVLSLLHPLISRLWSRLSVQKDGDGKSS